MSNDGFRRRLLHDRAVLLRQVATAEDDLRWLDANVEPEVTDEGQERALALVLARLDQRGQAEIEAIDRALARIAAGSYGTCAGCGHPIPTSRLEALPAADRCLRCATASEHVV